MISVVCAALFGVFVLLLIVVLTFIIGEIFFDHLWVITIWLLLTYAGAWCVIDFTINYCKLLLDKI